MGAIEGQWHDGRSSRARAVRLDRAGDALRIVDAADGSQAFWPLAEVVPSARLGATPRVLRRAGHGQIECADAPELAQWFPSPPSRIEALADWLERRRTAILVAALGAGLLVFAFLRIGVPWAAAEIAARLPEAVEDEVSRQTAAVLERAGYLRASGLPQARQDALRARFAALVAGQPRHQRMRLHFVGARGLGANAFVLPDGRIYVTDALVRLAGDDDEVLAVLAHEAGHHVHRHGMRQAIESSSVLLIAGLAFGDVSGSSVAVALPSVLLSRGYSRGHEREADAYAMALLRARGLPPQAFARIMRRLSERAPASDAGPLGYLSTHPPTPERIEAAERAARE